MPRTLPETLAVIESSSAGRGSPAAPAPWGRGAGPTRSAPAGGAAVGGRAAGPCRGEAELGVDPPALGERVVVVDTGAGGQHRAGGGDRPGEELAVALEVELRLVVDVGDGHEGVQEEALDQVDDAQN